MILFKTLKTSTNDAKQILGYSRYLFTTRKYIHFIRRENGAFHMNYFTVSTQMEMLI